MGGSNSNPKGPETIRLSFAQPFMAKKAGSEELLIEFSFDSLENLTVKDIIDRVFIDYCLPGIDKEQIVLMIPAHDG